MPLACDTCHGRQGGEDARGNEVVCDECGGKGYWRCSLCLTQPAEVEHDEERRVCGRCAEDLEARPPLCSCERRPVEWNHRTNRPMRMCEQCAAEEEGDRRCKERREEGWR